MQTETSQPPLQRFAPFEAPLVRTSLIEASAGTGKTYTITGLYLRLILEGERRVDQILVVTFTNAATEELKDRILRRLLEVREAFSAGSSSDDFCRTLLERNGERELMLRRLENAIRGFDEAAIYTIHSFCQRVLRDQAFASGMPFETELRADVREMLQEIVEDFRRRHFYDASPLLVNYLLDQRYQPERFLQEISPHLGKPYLNILGG
jgi:exodeoxyribonuclease V beta subunit